MQRTVKTDLLDPNPVHDHLPLLSSTVGVTDPTEVVVLDHTWNVAPEHPTWICSCGLETDRLMPTPDRLALWAKHVAALIEAAR